MLSFFYGFVITTLLPTVTEGTDALQLATCLPTVHRVLGPSQGPHKPGMGGPPVIPALGRRGGSVTARASSAVQ